MSEFVTNTQPAESLSARIDFAQAAAARLRASGTHEPSPGLAARIARLPAELRASATLLARQGYDATDALLQLYEEGQALARLQARLDRGESLSEEEARLFVRGSAALARARAGLPPREELPVSDHVARGPEPTPQELARVNLAAAKAHASQTESERAAYAAGNR